MTSSRRILSVQLETPIFLTMAISTFGYNLLRRGITRAIFLDLPVQSALLVQQVPPVLKVQKAAADLDLQQTGG